MSTETIFYDWSGGMESSAMLVVDRQRIADLGAIVRWADTGKHFPEMYDSKRQIESILGLDIVTVPRRITFDEYLFERGGMLRKGMNDCSRRMKRANLNRHLLSFPRPYEVNIGFNNSEDDRAASFSARNERDWLHWRYPLIEANVSREQTWAICRDAGFAILVGMYEKMGRFDCFFCPNQQPRQARKVVQYYPDLGAEWIEIERRKGHSILRTPFHILIEKPPLIALMDSSMQCACFGGDQDIAAEIEADGE